MLLFAKYTPIHLPFITIGPINPLFNASQRTTET